jgi:hypothetical protein
MQVSVFFAEKVALFAVSSGRAYCSCFSSSLSAIGSCTLAGSTFSPTLIINEGILLVIRMAVAAMGFIFLKSSTYCHK